MTLPTIPIAQMCSGSRTFQERLLDWNFIEAGVCQYGDSMGFLTFGMLFYSGIIISIGITTRSPVLPAILLMATGAAVIGQLAAPAIPFVVLLIVLNGAGAMTYLYLKAGSSY